ncbi:MAG: GIY-YIG nuclease family protein [Nanoarchaeota archaeon]
MISGVYQIVNINTKKFYIGSAKDLETRYKKDFDWKNHHNSDLAADAINGDRYIFIVIQECASHAAAMCMEQLWLDFYVMNNLWDSLYNKNKCVWNLDFTGNKHTQETKDKIRAAQKIIQNKPEVKAAKSAIQTGKKQSQETKDKIGAARTGKKQSQETKDKIGGTNSARYNHNISTNEIIELHNAGMSIKEISQKLCCTRSIIIGRIDKERRK